MKQAQTWQRHIHLLYVPTLCCNLSCSYCYLGAQTTEAALAQDAARAVATLRTALERLEQAQVLAFNVSLHGGEVTTMPPAVLDQLFTLIRQHYLRHFDAIQALGHKKSGPHIKTNLYKFASLYPLLDRHKVSISASIDLPLAMHAKHRTTRRGQAWLDRTLEHLRLLAQYPHSKKISATLTREHLSDIPALIQDIWFIHRELGLDMTQFNLMFAFGSALNQAHQGGDFAAVEPALQVRLYQELQTAFAGTELEEGFLRHWFDEFTPSYCTSAQNCGEKFYLLQSDGEVYSCVRGQGIKDFHYGNLLRDDVHEVLATGARKISLMHQKHGFDSTCQSCNHLSRCHTGCPVVKYQQQRGRSYTCDLQRQIYQDQPQSYPPVLDAHMQQADRQNYARSMHPALSFTSTAAPALTAAFQLPQDLPEPKNTLAAIIAQDPILQKLYSAEMWFLEHGEHCSALESQILKSQTVRTIVQTGDHLVLHVRRDLLEVACDEPMRNTVYLQMLRDTPVVYGDEKRNKQAHLFSYQCFSQALQPSARLGPDFYMLDLGPLLDLHQHLYQRGVANNLLVTTQYLRDYHYQKQKNNAFYHIQAVNLPFANFEFYYLAPPADKGAPQQ